MKLLNVKVRSKIWRSVRDRTRGSIGSSPVRKQVETRIQMQVRRFTNIIHMELSNGDAS